MEPLRPPTALAPGRSWPLGAQWDGDELNFAVVSAHASRIELCLFDAGGRHEVARLPLPGRTGDVFHGRLPGAAPGLVYGYRAHGPWRPDRGHRFNPHKVLLDPYAREIVGRFEWRDEQFGADRAHPAHMDQRDNAPYALKARVGARDAARAAALSAQPQLHTPPADTVIYELHVRGFTMRHPGVPEALRGTYAGLASPAALAHLKRLGITAVCLLPVHQHLDEERLGRLGLVNYWGYNTIGYFCPEPKYASGAGGLAPAEEFRAMVRALHDCGIEVLLDVVYNHTAEGDEQGPTLAWRGLDNALYYRLPPAARAQYENHTGCGNTLDLRQPRVLQLVLDSLRFWVGEMGVDGFRFDLATVLGRGEHRFDPNAAFFAAVAQDPLLQRVKLIAEPWDVGHDGYQLGAFPNGWLEWNDRFRDTLRGFWIGQRATRGAFAQRLAASSDLFQPRGRSPAETVNYVVSHDGFNLTDLVSYAERHNHANGEHNRDGHHHNLSGNCGVEGPSSAAAVVTLRGRLKRALLATVLLAQGTPMLAAGDELGHSQRGNNNPYCQDNPTTWLDWAGADDALTGFVARLVALRRELLPFALRWYDGIADGHGVSDLSWLRGDGAPLQGADWQAPDQQVLGCLIGKPGRAAMPLLLLVNGGPEAVEFALPRAPAGAWQRLVDTAEPAASTAAWQQRGAAPYPLAAHSLALLGTSAHNVALVDTRAPGFALPGTSAAAASLPPAA
jgi:glycogen operon protein